MTVFEMAVSLSVVLCGMVAGVTFAFAVVVMPGIRDLGDRDYLRAFKAIDGVIQRGQPLFMLAWLGSAVAVVVSALLSFWHADGAARLIAVVAAGVYLLGVQLPTLAINVPLNNRVQALDLETLDDTRLGALRAGFDGRWMRWNVLRTVLAIASVALLLVVLTRG